MSLVYEDVGYGARKVGFGDKVAILVVDFQKGFTDPQYVMGRSPLIHRAVDETVELLALARHGGLPVACCYHAHVGSFDMPHWKQEHVRSHMIVGSEETVLDPRITDGKMDYCFRKTGASMFHETPIKTFLTTQGVDTVVVTGCVTSGCIRATVIQAFEHGYRVIVPAECVGDMEEGPHNANLTDIDRRYADVLAVENVKRSLFG